MFIEKPILSGIGLMMTCFVAFMAQASICTTLKIQCLHTKQYATAQEVGDSKRKKEAKSLCQKPSKTTERDSRRIKRNQ
jgi:hypothetical protein